MTRIGMIIRSAKMNATTPPKSYPAVPQHGRQRHVADRADEAEHRDDRADDRPPQPGGQRIAGEEQVLPERLAVRRELRSRPTGPCPSAAHSRRPCHAGPSDTPMRNRLPTELDPKKLRGKLLMAAYSR